MHQGIRRFEGGDAVEARLHRAPDSAALCRFGHGHATAAVLKRRLRPLMAMWLWPHAPLQNLEARCDGMVCPSRLSLPRELGSAWAPRALWAVRQARCILVCQLCRHMVAETRALAPSPSLLRPSRRMTSPPLAAGQHGPWRLNGGACTRRRPSPSPARRDGFSPRQGRVYGPQGGQVTAQDEAPQHRQAQGGHPRAGHPLLRLRIPRAELVRGHQGQAEVLPRERVS